MNDLNIDNEKNRLLLKAGKQAEKQARTYLKNVFSPQHLLQMDWGFKYNGNWYSVEVKYKSELFKANIAKGAKDNFDGHGLDIRQVNARMELYRDKDIRCLFLVFDKDSDKIYSQWLDILKSTPYYDTTHKVRIYNIKYFEDSTHKEEDTFFNQEIV